LWFIHVYFMEHPIKMDALGIASFQEASRFMIDL